MDQEQEVVDARELFEALRDYDGAHAYTQVVSPWLARAAPGYLTELAGAGARLCRPTFDGPADARQDLLWELYALSRVSDVLLLAFQPPPESGATAAWAHELHLLELWPMLDLEHYLELLGRLGMVPFEETGVFDPFLREIVEVEEAADPDEPIRITEVVWPGLWSGPLMFSRAGVRIRAGAHHAERGVADRSPLYWTFLRRHRPTVDLSHGWGSNSQWRTDFRLDYRTSKEERVNADAQADIDDPGDRGLPRGLLTATERRELLRHRCLLRTPSNAEALAATGSWQTDLWPFDWQLPPRQTGR